MYNSRAHWLLAIKIIMHGYDLAIKIKFRVVEVTFINFETRTIQKYILGYCKLSNNVL